MSTRSLMRISPFKPRLLVMMGSVLGFLSSFQAASAQSCVGTNGVGGNEESIKFTGVQTGWMNYAIGKWTNCNGISDDFLKTSGSADITVQIEYKNEHNASTCGTRNPTTGKITLWATSKTLGGQTYNCSKKDTLAHEMGHTLGLKNSTCSGHMMGPGGAPQSCGDELCAAPRGNPKVAECNKVREVWDELPDPPGGGDDDDPPDDQTPCDGPNDPPGCSPIVIDMLGDGLRFSDAEQGVDFDIRRVDRLVRIAWTRRENDDVFLALDRDDNRWIDDGGELFGNITDQPESDEPNGYDALALFDTPEFFGNGDSKIDRSDKVYSILTVWHDHNHNGISEPGELYSLMEAGIEAIYLDYWRSRERDKHGNELRYFGRVCLSAKAETLASHLASERTPLWDEGSSSRNVLDPMGLRDGTLPAVVRSTECDGSLVQSTDVFFVSDGWSDSR